MITRGLTLVSLLTALLLLQPIGRAQEESTPSLTISDLYRANIKVAIAGMDSKAPLPGSYDLWNNEDIFSSILGDIKSGNRDRFTEASLLSMGFSKAYGFFERDRGLGRLFVAVSSGSSPTVEATLTLGRQIRVSEAVINSLMARSPSLDVYTPTDIDVILATGETSHFAITHCTWRHIISIGFDGILHEIKITDDAPQLRN